MSQLEGRTPAIRGRFSTTGSGLPLARIGLLLPAALLVLGCRIAPVITNPEQPHGRHRDCERAAEDYCEHVVGASESRMEKCVAEFTFKCVAGETR